MNDTGNLKNQSGLLPLQAKIALATWLGVAGLVTIIGNGIVLWLIFRKRSLRTMSNLFLTSLAAADLLVGLVIDPVWLLIRCLGYNPKTYFDTFSKGMDFLWIHTTVATSFNLCCVSLDRYIAIIHPLRYQDFLTERRCYLLIANVWFMSLVLPCSRLMVQDKTVLSTLYLSFTVITILFAMFIIVFCCLRILKAASAHYNGIKPTSSCAQNQDSFKRTKKNFKAAKTVSFIVGLFVVSWLPSLITGLVYHFSKKVSFESVYYTVWTSVETVAFTSSAINPWVYCLRNDEFYEALSRTFRFPKFGNLDKERDRTERALTI
ncbi:probable G-protein coupled receptor No9 [Stylophora pistillata]|uniref:probable G-protein coupled receptor No9 n=1 Tax=Stylophora pistillata TaxID=50429 RepID=UPI000C049C32|nr:probable G-protein coupled receptor No9 [Stylophora pistillata]